MAYLQEASGLMGSVIGLALLGFGFMSFRHYRKLKQSEESVRRRLAEVERQLNEAEAAIESEPQIMMSWRGRDDKAERAIGRIHELQGIPSTAHALEQFDQWLDGDSASLLGGALRELKTIGTGFNFAIKTLEGDLLEATGRAVTGLATLRIRPLAGERRTANETVHDAQKLAKQVERLSAILDAAPFPIWIKGAGDKTVWVNQSFVKTAEVRNSAEVIAHNTPIAKLESPPRAMPDAPDNWLGRAHAVQNGQMKAYNLFQTRLSIGDVGYAIDVTQQEQLEKELARHINAHASTLDKLNTAIAIFGPDQRLRFFNQAYVALWGLEESWLQTQPSDGEILDRLRASRNLPEEANYREWRAKQLAAYTNLELRETYWYLPDGRSLRVICEQHPFGGVTYLYENLTKEYQLESRYNELFEVQRETLDNLAEAVALSGPDGRLKLFNPAFMRFWALDSQFLAEKPHVEQLAQLASLSSDSRIGWQDIKFSVTGIESNRKGHEGRMTQDGRILRYRAVPLPDGNALITFSDVSDAAKAEQALRDRAEALEAADRLKNSILANVSYEVRTPLTSIVGFAETLEYGIAGPLTPKQREYVVDIRKSSEDLKLIIDAIIDLSAIDAGQMELQLTQIDIAKLLTAAAEKISPILQKRKLRIEIEITEDADVIIGDHDRLEQTLVHLLSNAAGFSSEGSVIQMGARRRGENIQLWVADHGRGIEPELQRKVFDRFQAKPSAGGHRGPGLGLALVKSFTELHGGTVSLVSKIDQGTTVVCTLPVQGPSRKNRNSANIVRSNSAA
ncbi:MAG: PAS-domain containing protein [Alphaproteobacteria bacterium]|nr:PAS-domain containing protein [Alphaproteobacteria bacterium]